MLKPVEHYMKEGNTIYILFLLSKKHHSLLSIRLVHVFLKQGFTGLVFNTDFKNIFHFFQSFNGFSQFQKISQFLQSSILEGRSSSPQNEYFM